jgi:hypothetical protein
MGKAIGSTKVCRGCQIVKLIIQEITFDITSPTNCSLKTLPQFLTKFNGYLHSELHGQQSCPQSQ